MIENLVRDAHEKGGFTGTWLYAEHGEAAPDDDLLGPARYGYGWDNVRAPTHGLIVCHSGDKS